MNNLLGFFNYFHLLFSSNSRRRDGKQPLPPPGPFKRREMISRRWFYDVARESESQNEIDPDNQTPLNPKMPPLSPESPLNERKTLQSVENSGKVGGAAYKRPKQTSKPAKQISKPPHNRGPGTSRAPAAKKVTVAEARMMLKKLNASGKGKSTSPTAPERSHLLRKDVIQPRSSKLGSKGDEHYKGLSVRPQGKKGSGYPDSRKNTKPPPKDLTPERQDSPPEPIRRNANKNRKQARVPSKNPWEMPSRTSAEVQKPVKEFLTPPPCDKRRKRIHLLSDSPELEPINANKNRKRASMSSRNPWDTPTGTGAKGENIMNECERPLPQRNSEASPPSPASRKRSLRNYSHSTITQPGIKVSRLYGPPARPRKPPAQSRNPPRAKRGAKPGGFAKGKGKKPLMKTPSFGDEDTSVKGMLNDYHYNMLRSSNWAN